jgi:hypothetical protein
MRDRGLFTVKQFETDGDIEDRVREFIAETAGLIEAIWRRRDADDLRWTPVAEALFAAFKRAPRPEGALLLASSGVPPELALRFLDPHAIGEALNELDAVAGALGVSLHEALAGRPPHRHGVRQEQALVEMADEYHLSHAEHVELRRSAEQDMALGRLRHGLRNVEEWVRYRRVIGRRQSRG